jgi:branched-chain amino acid transport system substrate-binding protein
MKQAQRLAASYGIAVGVVERMEMQDKDATAQLTKIRASNPDAVFFVGSGATVAVVCKTYTRLGMKQPLVISTGAVSANFPALLKGIAPDTLIFPTYKMLLVHDLPASDPNREPIQTFLKLFEEKYKKKTDFYAGAGWDLANIAIAAMRKVGNDRTKIRDAIQQVKRFPGTMAVLTFAPENHRGAGEDAQLMGQFKNDKFVLIK